MERKAFIEHLAGLRGIAILLVVLFHIFGQGVWENGYLGVDIFLVITGYLMIRARIAEPGVTGWRGFFSYLLRRVQRVVPPMLVVILVSVLVGMLLLWWKDEKSLSVLGYAACLAKANVRLKQEFANYFAPDSAYMPLLHLWYLSVILQVYLLFAIGNQVLQRLPRKVIVAVLSVLGVASLLYNYNVSLTELLTAMGAPAEDLGTEVSYYQTLSRLWEVLAGGLVCVLPSIKNARVACIAVIAGMLCVLFAAFSPVIPGADTVAKSLCTLIMVTGTVLLLRYTPQCRVIHKILSHKILVWFGGISFSLYLVHMPVVVYMRVWTLGQPGLWMEMLMVVVSLILGYLFMLGVERRRCPLWITVVLWCVTFLLCRTSRKTEGFRAYLPAGDLEVAYTDWKMCEDTSLVQGVSTKYLPFRGDVFFVMNQSDKIPSKVCMPLMVMGNGQKPVTCVLIGDSHAASLYAGMDVMLKEEQISGVYLASYVYAFHRWKEDKQYGYKGLLEREKALMRWLRAQPSITHVIAAQRWHIRFNSETQQQQERDLRTFLQELRDIGKKVVVIAPTPEFPKQPPFLHFDKILTLRHIHNSPADMERAAYVCGPERYLRLNKTVLPILYRMRDEGLCVLIEPMKALRPGEVFRTVQDGKVLMCDDNHMSPGLSIPLVQKLRPFLREALKRDVVEN